MKKLSGAAMGVDKSDDLVALCKRRGFIFQSDEIYGGVAVLCLLSAWLMRRSLQWPNPF